MAAIFQDGGYQITVKSTKTRKVLASIYIGGTQVTVPVTYLQLTITPRAQLEQSLGGKLYVSSADGDVCTGVLKILDNTRRSCPSETTAPPTPAYGGLLDIMKLQKNKGITNRSVRIVLYDQGTAATAVDFSGIITTITVLTYQGESSSGSVYSVSLELTGGLSK